MSDIEAMQSKIAACEPKRIGREDVEEYNGIS